MAGSARKERDCANAYRGREPCRERRLRGVGCFGRLQRGARAAVRAADEHHEYGLSGHPTRRYAESGRDRRCRAVYLWLFAVIDLHAPTTNASTGESLLISNVVFYRRLPGALEIGRAHV